MRPLSEPRRRFVSERPQTLLPLEGLSLRLLPAGGGAAARHGRTGRTEAAASSGGEEGTGAGRRESEQMGESRPPAGDYQEANRHLQANNTGEVVVENI